MATVYVCRNLSANPTLQVSYFFVTVSDDLKIPFAMQIHQAGL